MVVAKDNIVSSHQYHNSVNSSLHRECSGGEIEVTFQEMDRKHDDIPQVPVIEDGPFVYQIIRNDGVAIYRSIIDFFSVPRNDVFASATSTMDEDTVADYLTDQNIAELLSEEEEDGLDVEEDQSESQDSSQSGDHENDQESIIRCSELIEVEHVITLGMNSFLRLADHSGWVAAQFGDEVAAKRVNLEKGLWSWCVDNFPEGITVRNHPMDSPELLPSERNRRHKKLNRTILPLQRIYCDARVKHPTTGVTFYRLQSCSAGNNEECVYKQDFSPFQQIMSRTSTETEDTAESVHEDDYTILSSMRDKAKMTFQAAASFASQGWVFDRIIAPIGTTEHRVNEQPYLIDDKLVTLNHYAVYQALTDDLFIQAHTDTTYNSQRADELRIKKGDMVVVTVIRQSPAFEQHGNGPFLYLADGSGWLYENRNHHQVMKAVSLASGYWECVVKHNSSGVCMLRHPLDVQEGFFAGKVAFPPGSLLQCDRKVTSQETGITFYRVVGSEGWVPDKIVATTTLEILSCSPSSETRETVERSSVSANGWNADFVRGILATEPSYQETNFETNSCVITFVRTDDKAGRLNIFLKTQTVGIIAEPFLSGRMDACKHQKCKRNCSARDLLEIIQGHWVEDIYPAYNEMLEGEEKKEVDVVDLLSTKFREDTTFHDDQSDREKEEELRQQLLVCDNEINLMTSYRRKLLRQLTIFDEMRTVELKRILKFDTSGTNFNEMHIQDDHAMTFQEHRSPIVDNHETFNERALRFAVKNTASDILGFLKKTRSTIHQADSVASENIVGISKVRAIRSELSDSASAMISVGSSRKQFVCGECLRTFNGKYSRDIHCREIHGLHCASCDMIFESRNQLDHHLRDEH